jgi:hypothetical protein
MGPSPTQDNLQEARKGQEKLQIIQQSLQKQLKSTTSKINKDKNKRATDIYNTAFKRGQAALQEGIL